jgi:hypothetical protein
MWDLLELICSALIGRLRSSSSLELENLALRHQLNVLRRRSPKRPVLSKSPWQNGHAERLIGSIRRECLDHLVIFGERHLRHMLRSYAEYYNAARTHLSLVKDAPVPRAALWAGISLL